MILGLAVKPAATTQLYTPALPLYVQVIAFVYFSEIIAIPAPRLPLNVALNSLAFVASNTLFETTESKPFVQPVIGTSTLKVNESPATHVIGFKLLKSENELVEN